MEAYEMIKRAYTAYHEGEVTPEIKGWMDEMKNRRVYAYNYIGVPLPGSEFFPDTVRLWVSEDEYVEVYLDEYDDGHVRLVRVENGHDKVCIPNDREYGKILWWFAHEVGMTKYIPLGR